MKKKNYSNTIITVSLAAFLLMVAGVTSVSAFGPVGKGNFRFELSDEDRQVLEDARELFEEGDEEQARALLEDAGIEIPIRGPKHFDAIRQAIEDNDYAAFVDATEDAPFKDQITQDVFDKIVEAHDLHESGDDEGARAIIESLGFDFHPHGPRGPKGLKGPGFNNGLGDLSDEDRAELKALRKSGDRDAVKSFFEERGIGGHRK